MSAASAAARGRRKAAAAMTLAVTAQIPGGKDADGFPAYVPQLPHAGKVQGSTSSTKDTATRYVSIGGVDRPVLAAGLHIPIDAPVPVASEQRGIGWEYVVTAVGRYDDPALLGKRYLVVAAPVKSYATARRLDVVEV